MFVLLKGFLDESYESFSRTTPASMVSRISENGGDESERARTITASILWEQGELIQKK